MSNSDPPEGSPQRGFNEPPRASPSSPTSAPTPALLEPEDDKFDYGGIIERLRRAVASRSPPELLQFGGYDCISEYDKIFDLIYYPTRPIVDPQGRVIVFNRDCCSHICIAEDRFDKSRKRAEGEDRARTSWDQRRAEYILWILPALTTPSLIVKNRQQEGNLTYLLGYPAGDLIHPSDRYYVSVRPTSPKRAIFKTAFPITQEKWDQALRAPEQRRGESTVLYRGPSPRW